jgi:superfamily II DNA or RNA helicase
VDRRNLCEQTSAVADKLGLSAHSVMMASHWRFNKKLPFQIASAQTLMRRGIPDDFDTVVVDECFPPDVEILTEQGFIRFDQLPQSIKCAQYNAEDQSIMWAYPSRYIDKKYQGPMVHLNSDKRYDMSMTPNHQLLINYKHSGWRKVTAQNAYFNSANSMAVAGYAVGLDDMLSDYERLMIAYQADGSLHNSTSDGTYTLAFSLTKQRKIDRLLALVDRLGLRHAEVKGQAPKRRFMIYGVKTASKMIADTISLYDMDADKAVAIIDEMVEWDGHKHNDISWYYSSAVKANTDFYQAVAIMAGYRTNVTVQHDNRKESYKDMHRLFICKDTAEIGTQNIVKTTSHYEGRVYCVTVPTGNIIVRRNGKPLVVGNCHVQYGAIMKHIESCRGYVVGLSATPFSPGLGKVYTNLINAATMDELTKQGILVPMKIFSCSKIDMKGAETRGGEWTEKAAETRGLEIVGDVVSEWVKYASTRKTIVFGATIAHCEEMARQFMAAGIEARVFCATTTDDERAEILAEYEKIDSKIRVLISVEALAKGFDIKDVECVCDCRPLRKSLSTAIQMWGRGLRSSPDTGKEDCYLLDFSGNIIRFADDFSEIFYNGLDQLDMGEKLDKTIRRDDEEKEPPKCPKCGFTPCGKLCISCGYERKSKPSTVEVQSGTMQEITLNGKKLADDSRHLYEQIVTHTRSTGKPETAKQRAYYLYKDMAGKNPPTQWKFEDVPNTPITRNVANKIKSLRLAWVKRREAR